LGRPSAFTKAMGAEICRRLEEGESLRAICRDVEMPGEGTVRNWATPGIDEEFAARFHRIRGVAGFRLLGRDGPTPYDEDEQPVAWRINAWCRQVADMSRSTFYEECQAGRIKTVKMGAMTLVLTPPREYIAQLCKSARLSD